ncbi:MAG: LPS assembly protein LptD [Syntrophobacteria bacterium]
MRKTVRIVGLCLLVAFLFFPDLPAGSQDRVGKSVAAPGEDSGYRLRADHFSYDERQSIYTARGNVTLHAPGRVITADEIRLDALTREAILEGDIRIEQGNDWLEGERAFLDLEEQTGIIEYGKGFLAEGNFHFSGAIIEKLGPQTYHVEQANFTTCDGDRPSWHFRTSDLRVTLEGYAFAKHSRFHLGSVPVLYTPYLVFPAKTKRQTGLLPPRLGKGDRLGWDVDLPFFWAISRSTDATIYSHYMSKRGLMLGPEFRYAASKENKGVLRFDYLHDQEDRDELREQNFYTLPGLTRATRDRWWWRSKQDIALPHGIQGKMDLDFASDPDYLQTFSTGFSSWAESDRVFRKTFGRGLINDETITTRESNLLLNKTWAAQAANFELHYFQNLNDDEDETTLQQLPLVTYSASKQPLLGGPFFWQGNAIYVDYWRPEGTRGHRVNLDPRLSLPLRRGGYLELEPFVGILETAYLIEHYDEPADSRVREKTFNNRALFEAGVDGSTEIVGIFSMDGDTWTKTKHIVRPQIGYEYRPEVSQNKLPSFDSTDRVNSRNRITYGLVNFFSARLDQAPGEVEYHDFARLEISQFYDISQPDGGVEDISTSRDQPFSNVFTQLDFTPKRYLNFTYKNQYSPYDGDFKSHELLARLWDQRGDELTVDYRRQLDEDGKTIVEEIGTQLKLNLWEGVSVNVRSDYDLKRTRNIKSEYNIMLQRQCWGISVSYVDDPSADDRRVALGISLYGVGELQTQTYSSSD